MGVWLWKWWHLNEYRSRRVENGRLDFNTDSSLWPKLTHSSKALSQQYTVVWGSILVFRKLSLSLRSIWYPLFGFGTCDKSIGPMWNRLINRRFLVHPQTQLLLLDPENKWDMELTRRSEMLSVRRGRDAWVSATFVVPGKRISWFFLLQSRQLHPWHTLCSEFNSYRLMSMYLMLKLRYSGLS